MSVEALPYTSIRNIMYNTVITIQGLTSFILVILSLASYLSSSNIVKENTT